MILSKKHRYLAVVTLLALIIFSHPASVDGLPSLDNSICYSKNEDRYDLGLNQKASTYAFSAWVRPSLVFPCVEPVENLFSKTTLIMGVTNSKAGWGQKLDRYDHFMALFMSSIDNEQKFILRYDTNQQINQIELKFDSPILGYWFYMQFVYQSSTNTIFANVYKQNYNLWQNLAIVAENRNDQEGNLNFSLSKAEGSFYAPFNGHIQGVQFTTDLQPKYFNSKYGVQQLISTLNSPVIYGQLQNDYYAQFIKTTISNNSFYQNIPLNSGVHLYGVNFILGFKSNLDSKKEYKILRVGTLDRQDGSTNILDMEFCLNYVNGVFQIVTYSLVQGMGFPQKIEFNLQKVKVDTKNRINLGFTYIDYNKTFWVRAKHENDRNYETYKIINVSKIDNTQLNFYANESKEQIEFTIQSTIGGRFENDWTNFEENPIIIDKQWSSSLATYVPYQLPSFLLSKHSAGIHLSSIEATGNKITGSNRISTMHFWYRRDINEVEFSDLNGIRSSDLSIASLTETSYNKQNIEKVEIFGIYYRSHLNQKNPAYLIKTVNQKTKKTESIFVVDFTNQQAQNEWHLFFVSISYERQEIFYAVDFNNGKISSQLLTNFFHKEQYDVTAKLGISGFTSTTQKAVPGEFYNYQFITSLSSKDTFVNTVDLFKQYSANYCLIPKIREGKSINTPFENLSLPFQTISPTLFKYSKIYSVSMWARWDNQSGESISKNTIFQLSINKIRTNDTQSRLGDNALHVFVNEANVVFSTYSMGFLPEQDVSELQKTIPYDFSTGQWCYFYFGYNSNLQTARGFINCDDGVVKEVKFESVNHISPTEAYLQLGESYSYSKLIGNMTQPMLSANQNDLQGTELPQDSTKLRPPKYVAPNCTTFYSDCNFQTVLASACEDIPSIDLSQIKSIYLSPNITIRVFNQKNFNGLNIRFKKSVVCFENSLSGSKDLKWEALSAFFNEGVLSFMNDSGDEIPIEQAKAIFFSPNESDSSTPSLRRHIQRKTQDSISDNQFESQNSVF